MEARRRIAQGSPKDRPRIAQGWMPIFDKSVLYMYIYIVYIQFLCIFLVNLNDLALEAAGDL